MQQQEQSGNTALTTLPALRPAYTSKQLQSQGPANSSFVKPRTAPQLHAITSTAAGSAGNTNTAGTNRSKRCARSAGSAAVLSVAEYQSASADALQHQVQLVQSAVSTCQAAYSKARNEVDNCSERIQQLEQQISSLTAEDQQLSAKVPLPVNRLCRVRQWLAEKVDALAAEKAALEGKQMALLKAESQLRARETESELLAEAAGSLDSAAAKAASTAFVKAAAAHEAEVASAKHIMRQMRAQQQQAQQEQAQQQAKLQHQQQAAQDGQMAAKQRLAASQTAIRQAAAMVDELAAAEEERKRQALLSLKGRIDEVRDVMSKQADKYRQLQKQKREQERREFETLQEQGLNPYEVYRRRDIETASAKAAAELEASQAQRMAQIAAVLKDEEKEYKRRLRKVKADKQVEEEYQRNMGIAAQQQRTDAYMRNHTLCGQIILDPTSRLHPYPSDNVLVKPPCFGLGRSSPEAVSKVAKRHAGIEQDLNDSLLLPRQHRQTLGGTSHSTHSRHGRIDIKAEAFDESFAAVDDGEASRSSEDGSDDGGSSTAENDESDIGRDGLQQAADAGLSSTGTSLPVAKLSKLEMQQLQKAKSQHKATVSQAKTMFGRSFAGDAFIAEPTEVLFKDFVPGVTYKTAVQLINRSFCKNSIRLLEVPAEVADVIDLEMPPSGGLAPGASATLRVTFIPKAVGDLSASITLLSETGPLSLSLRCLARRAVPVVKPSPVVSLDGRAGGVMLAATSRKTVTISNEGALGVVYDIKVTGPLAPTTEYDEPEPPLPPPNATAADMAELQAKVWAQSSLSVAGFRVMGVKGQVQGYGSCTLSVEFTPRVAGPVEVPLMVRFSAPENKSLTLPPVQLLLTATGRDLPVSTSTPVIDFKTVMYGQQYAAQLLLCNAGKTAMKALICSRPELNDWVKFMPDFGFIQADDSFAVGVSLKPTAEMKGKLSKYLLQESDQHKGVYEVPLQVTVAGQTLPVPFKLRLQPTTTDLQLSPSLLDFGRVPVNESAGVFLTITNPSLLPQHFSFGPRLPLGLSISPNAGYGRVLPGDIMRLLVKFQPPIPGLQYFDLTCKTLTGRMFKVEGKCEGVQCDVTLSHNIVKFPATEVSDTNSASVVLYNKSNQLQLFEFGIPTDSYLQVTPRVGCLKANGSIRIQLDFTPPMLLMEQTGTAPAPHAAAAAAAAGSASTLSSSSGGDTPAAGANAGQTVACSLGSAAQQNLSQQQQQDATDTPLDGGSTAEATDDPSSSSSSNGGSTWLYYREWLLPCYTRPAGPQDDLPVFGTDPPPTASTLGMNSSGTTTVFTSSKLTNSGFGSSSNSSSSSVTHNVIHLSVTTCAVAPELQLVSPDLAKPAGKNYYVLDFGALPVGERVTKQLQLANKGSDVIPLSCDPLDPAGIFSIVNALRPIADHSSTKVLLAFSPEACTEYYEMLTLRSAKSRFRVALKGRGIAPTLAITPATATSVTGGLNFGDVLLSDPVQKEMKLIVTNTCPFDITYTTRFIGPTPKDQAVAAQMMASAAANAVEGRPRSATAGAQGSAASAAANAAATAAAAAPAAPAVAATAGEPAAPSGCFYCKPCSGRLAAGQSQELVIVLTPAGPTGQGLGPPSPYVSDRLQVLVPYQQQDVVIPLQAGVWPDGVLLAGVTYKSSNSSSLPMQSRLLEVASNSSSSAKDPFAAVVAAAAAMSQDVSAAAPAAAAGKVKQAATTAAPQQQQGPGVNTSTLGSLTAALAAAGHCDLTRGFVTLPGPVAPGQTSSATLEFGAVKASTGGGPGELAIDDLSAAAKEAGWSIDNLKTAAPAGERKPVVVRYTAPPLEKLKTLQLQGGNGANFSMQHGAGASSQGSLVDLGLPVEQLVELNCTMKGGCLPVPGGPSVGAAVAADGLRRLSILCKCVVVVPAAADVAGQGTADSSSAGSAVPVADMKKSGKV